MQFLPRLSCNFKILRINQVQFSVRFVTAISQRFRTCLKLVASFSAAKIAQKFCKWNTNFHWEVSTWKTGLPFQKFHFFRKFSSGTNQKVVFYLHPNRNFRNFLVNGKRPVFMNYVRLNCRIKFHLKTNNAVFNTEAYKTCI